MINIFISKLPNSYPIADQSVYLIGKWQELDPVFAGRLAYAAKSNKVRLKITEGFRTYERQAALYAQYLHGNLKLAEKPGRSWHEYRIAVDTSTQPIRQMTSAQLNKYGLCKPIKSEGWHIQPIETQGQTDRKKYMPIWQEDDEVAEPIYRKLSDVPSWYKEAVQKVIDKGGIKPDEGNNINITESMCRVFTALNRIGKL